METYVYFAPPLPPQRCWMALSRSPRGRAAAARGWCGTQPVPMGLSIHAFVPSDASALARPQRSLHESRTPAPPSFSKRHQPSWFSDLPLFAPSANRPGSRNLAWFPSPLRSRSRCCTESLSGFAYPKRQGRPPIYIPGGKPDEYAESQGVGGMGEGMEGMQARLSTRPLYPPLHPQRRTDSPPCARVPSLCCLLLLCCASDVFFSLSLPHPHPPVLSVLSVRLLVLFRIRTMMEAWRWLMTAWAGKWATKGRGTTGLRDTWVRPSHPPPTSFGVARECALKLSRGREALGFRAF